MWTSSSVSDWLGLRARAAPSENSTVPAPANMCHAPNYATPKAGECQPGIIIPIWAPSDVSGLSPGQRALRGCIFAVAIIYCFWGISVAADKYMDAIDYICGRSVQSNRRQ